MVLYMRVTNDKYELPEYVAASPAELAEHTGRTLGSVCSQLSKMRRGVAKTRYLTIDVPDYWEEPQRKYKKVCTVIATNSKQRLEFKSMKECAKHFNRSSSWISNLIKDKGNPFTWKGWTIEVREAGK